MDKNKLVFDIMEQINDSLVVDDVKDIRSKISVILGETKLFKAF